MFYAKSVLSKAFKPVATAAMTAPVLFYMHSMHQGHASFLELPSKGTILVGTYENKIRRSSPIEKIFEVFATVKTDSGLQMTYFDILRAICPFNFSTKEIEEMKKYLEENPPKNLKKLIDLDDSGDISVIEYYIFWILHEINIPDIKQHFGEDLKHLIKRDELKKFLKMRGKHAKINLTDTYLPDGRLAKVSKAEVDATLEKFLDRFYKENQEVPLSKFIKIKENFRREIYQFEFNTFEIEDGQMKGSDFAKSIISYAEPRKADAYLSAIDNLTHKDSLLTLNEYIAFKEFIIDDLDALESKFQKYGVLTKKKFTSLLKELCADNDYKLSDLQIEIIFETLDFDRNGKIDEAEYINLLKNAKKLARDVEENDGTYSMAPILDLKKYSLIWADKVVRIYDILIE